MNREELLRRYPDQRGRLMATLARLVGKADAEELANETLLRALAALDGFRGDAALGTWLHRIAVNLAHDLLRRRMRFPEQPMEDVPETPESIPDATAAEALERRQTAQCVQSMLSRLPARDRQVLILSDMLDWTAPEIARNERIATGNAKIRLHRARRAMKTMLESYCEFYRQNAGMLCCIPKSEAR